MAAFEAHYHTGPADLSLFGMPDDEKEIVRGNLAMPGGLSWLLLGDAEREVIGLDRFRPEDRPPVAISFFSYHLMITIGSFFLVLTCLAPVLRLGNGLFDQRWLLWILVVAVIPAFAANEAGWVAAEVGRQPWIVYPPLVTDTDGVPALDGHGRFQFSEAEGLRTSDGVSTVISSTQVLGSIIMFAGISILLFIQQFPLVGQTSCVLVQL